MELTRQARSVLHSAIDRLDEYTNTDMSNYMIRGNSIEDAEANPWDETPLHSDVGD